MQIDKDVIITTTLALLLFALTADGADLTETTELNRVPAPLLLAYLKATETPHGIRIRLRETDFGVGEAAFQEREHIELDRLARVLKAHPAMGVVLEGHADNRGDPDFNVMLSERRARSVWVALTKRGVEPSRMKIKGLGDSFPIATNETEQGRHRNRRVEVLLIEEEVPGSTHLTATP